MPGLTFWKHVTGKRTDPLRDAWTNTHHRHRLMSRTVVLTGAVAAFVAIASGAPVAGISIFLLTTVPFILSGT
ncbi:hypothetical protein [Burkholderia anthina]|uniref:hypothetical protein n=1 Tax=Burkholderia anthina TaxID=179879 RepID=UPI001FC7F5A4|nr:hypothetical protein [Burkholderia anthina]